MSGRPHDYEISADKVPHTEHPISESEALILAAEIDAVAKAIAATFNDLSGAAKARCLELAHHLGTIRRRIS